MIVLQIASLILWLFAVPFCIGLLPLGLIKKELHSPGAVWISGYILQFFLLEIVGIPIVLNVNYHGFSVFSWCFSGILLLCALAGIGTYIRARKKASYPDIWNDRSLSSRKFRCVNGRAVCCVEEKIMWGLFFGLLFFQLYMAFTRASFDGDDAYYGVQALTAQQMDVMYRINPNNGWSTELDARHALALFPMWEAFIGRMSGIHATIICHSVIPLVLIPLTYVLYHEIGKLLFRKRKDLQPMFMVILALWQMFGNVSIYTAETFFLTRTWQGKSFAANFILPAVFWIFLALFAPEKDGNMEEKYSDSEEKPLERGKAIEEKALKKSEEIEKRYADVAQKALEKGGEIEKGYADDEEKALKKSEEIEKRYADVAQKALKKGGDLEKKHKKSRIGLWILLGCLNLAGGASSSLAILLSTLLTAGLAVLFALGEKSFAVLVKAGCACIPGGIYILLYIVLSPWY